MSVVVFLGPSLPLEEARAILPARYLPPVACGDVQRLLERSPLPSAIGVIDGLFQTKPSVFHKEILRALDLGVPVLGASSMGALRAAELADFGMIGVGVVFQAYRSGELEDDDEVAVTHGSAETGFRPLSTAMVNLRVGLTRAAREGLIGQRTASDLERLAKAAFYANRSWEGLYVLGRCAGLPEGEIAALAAYVKQRRPDAKREDAIALLSSLSALHSANRAPEQGSRPSFTFAQSSRWRALRDAVREADRQGRALSDGAAPNTLSQL